jgi:hypothetical protein
VFFFLLFCGGFFGTEEQFANFWCRGKKKKKEEEENKKNKKNGEGQLLTDVMRIGSIFCCCCDEDAGDGGFRSVTSGKWGRQNMAWRCFWVAGGAGGVRFR